MPGGTNGADAAINRLRDASLLTEIEERQPDGHVDRRFEVHPTIARLALQHHRAAGSLREEAHRRAGEFLEAATLGATDLFVRLEGAHHLSEVGEVDRAFDLLGPLAQWLQKRGRMFDSDWVLDQLSHAGALEPRRQAILFDLRSDVRMAQGDLAGALDAFEDARAICERLAEADPGNAQWQRDLIISHVKLGDLHEHGVVARDDARERYAQALATAEALHAEGRLAPTDCWMIDALRTRLAAVSAAPSPQPSPPSLLGERVGVRGWFARMRARLAGR